ncbi:MAG: HAMP domain-containing histidine kinase [Winogradskyella sp.]|nr:HAMP domain-containing histidine kinase [Winogradskyella sp.]
MNDKRYRWILYTIVTVIVTTIGIQIYWNYKNYQTNKQQLINDVQISLDKAVDDYYTDLAERTTVGIFLEGDRQLDEFIHGDKMEQLFGRIDESKNEFENIDNIPLSNLKGVTIVKGLKVDSMNKVHDKKHPSIFIDSLKNQVSEIKALKGKAGLSNIEMLTSKIVVSIKNDTLDLKKVDSLVHEELTRKNVSIDFYLNYTDPDRLVENNESPEFHTNYEMDDYLQTNTKSTFLPKGTLLSILFTNTTKAILKRSLVGISISTLLVLAVISCLFYLLKIINHQKQLAEVKNDLISNITHEFKTPIATISVALESINNFNGIDDKEKTKKYINMSSQQLEKLNTMVEKLLETATLDSDNLELKKDPIDIIELLSAMINRYRIQFPEKQFETSFKFESLIIDADIFHIENAFNNILDNAVKYGGAIISIDIIPNSKTLDILFSDNGNALNKANKDRIFEKFYRIPKGNTHDVKGFGIGLYYTKTILEKHKGSVNLELHKNLTTFKISLPNG